MPTSEVYQSLTHYVPEHAPANGRYHRATCGRYVDFAREHRPDPTCPNCLHLLELEAEEDRVLAARWLAEEQFRSEEWRAEEQRAEEQARRAARIASADESPF